jgi:uncharacterized protein YmfQ (DUF2313 family)
MADAVTLATDYLAATEAPDSASLSGYVRAQAALAASEAPDAASFGGWVPAQVTLAANEAPDTASFAGWLQGQATLAATEAADTASFSGLLAVLARLLATEAPDTASVNGLLAVLANLAATEAPDSASIAAYVPAQATLAATEGADYGNIPGLVQWQGVLAATEQADVASSIGSVTWPGGLAAFEAPDLASFSGNVWVGSMVAVEQGDTADMSGIVLLGMSAYEDPDSANFSGVTILSGDIKATEQGDSAQFLGPTLLVPPPLRAPGAYTFALGEDRHIRRSGDDYAQQFLTLLPTGQAWPRATESTLYRVCYGLSEYWGFVDGRAADLLERESDPRETIELLTDWERAWGLPDPCFPSMTTIGERQKMLVFKMTLLGGQSREWYQRAVEWLGYTIQIKEFAPFMAGISECGETRYEYDQSGYFRWYIGPPEMRFYWTAETGQPAFVWFRAGKGQAGVDHHLEIRVPNELECLLQRWKPAQTQVVMDMSSVAFGGPMQGTP